ncbi:MAG TPA: sodium:solute symporter family protein [Methylovirgula sp.]|nr:sodium:solute symporter family protein [Methylovirgula sp.]
MTSAILITYGTLAVFFAIVVLILQVAHIKDRNFTEFAVAGRSFGGAYQAMAFLNTYLPGTIFIAGVGFIASKGVIGFYQLPACLIGQLTMYVMARRVWTWGSTYDLRTQADLLGLRFGSRAVRILASLVGVLALLPFLVLGMQSLGAVFSALSFGRIGYTSAVVIGVAAMAVRQIWTMNMGMRGIVISDFFQGIVAYGIGTLLIIGLIAWLGAQGIGFTSVEPRLYVFPGPASPVPLAFFSLELTLVLGSLCFPDLFIRLYTADGVRSVKQGAALGAPIALVFLGGLNLLALLSTALPGVAGKPQDAWFALAGRAGGPFALALAGTMVFAASMGNFDATVQSCATQLANDVLGACLKLSSRQLTRIARATIAILTIATAAIACLPLPQLFTLVLFGLQAVIQLSVPLYLGIFTRFGNSTGAAGGLIAGIATLAVLDLRWPLAIPWAFGLNAGLIALGVNLLVYVVAGVLRAPDMEEHRRIERLFAALRIPPKAPAEAPSEGAPAAD